MSIPVLRNNSMLLMSLWFCLSIYLSMNLSIYHLFTTLNQAQKKRRKADRKTRHQKLPCTILTSKCKDCDRPKTTFEYSISDSHMDGEINDLYYHCPFSGSAVIEAVIGRWSQRVPQNFNGKRKYVDCWIKPPFHQAHYRPFLKRKCNLNPLYT